MDLEVIGIRGKCGVTHLGDRRASPSVIAVETTRGTCITSSLWIIILTHLDLFNHSTITMSGGFFGFDTALPERHGSYRPNQSNNQFGGFQPSSDTTFNLGHQGEEEDLAVYTWGQGGSLLEGNDEANDETFGNLGDIGLSFLCVPTRAYGW